MPRLVFVQDGRAAAAMRLRRVREQMDRYGIGQLEEIRLPQLRAGVGPGGETACPPLADAQLLLAACEVAARRGCGPVVWAAARGNAPDVDRPAAEGSTAANAANTANTANAASVASVSARLAAAETCLLLEQLQEAAGVLPVAIETPFIELELSQVMTLGRRAEVDPALAWACGHGGPAPCGVCSGCRALQEATRAGGTRLGSRS